MWTSVADLFTPASLFLFLNLTIAAIAITSRKTKHPPSPLFESDHRYHNHNNHHHHHNEHLLPRQPSLLERLRSLNFNFSTSYDSDSETNTPTRHFDGGRHHFSNGGSSHPTTPTARALERASSLFKSLNHNLSPLRRPDPDHHRHFFTTNDGESPSQSLPTTPTARPLERASSLLKSLHFSPLRRPDPEPVNPERHFFATNDDGSSPPTTPTARALERASSLFKSHGFSLLSRSGGPDPEPVNPEPRHHHRNHFFATDDGSSSPPTTPTARMLERASSLFKSRHFSPLRRPDPEPVSEPRAEDHLVKRSKSETEVREAAAAGGAGAGRGTARRAAGSAARMTKSASEKCAAEVVAAVEAEVEEEERRRPATVRLQKAVSIGDDGGVDSKADDFINRFKQQLKLQRLDSLIRNRELLRAQQQQEQLQHS